MPKQKNSCSVCTKEPGICNCAGCKAFFCTKDFMDHRQWLSGELEEMVEIRNHFREEVSDRSKLEGVRAALFVEINRWEDDTIKKVRCIAEKTRCQANKLLDDKVRDIENELNDVTEQLRKLQEENNFVEDDLARILKDMDKLKEQFKQFTEPNSVKICKEKSEQIEWTSLIHVDKEFTSNDTVKSQSLSTELKTSISFVTC
jgi:chromosome segregation ATPase